MCTGEGPMSLGAGPSRRAVSAAAGPASVVAQTVLPPRAAKLRAERGMAALLLAARGGARYAGSAPRLFTAAGAWVRRARDRRLGNVPVDKTQARQSVRGCPAPRRCGG